MTTIKSENWDGVTAPAIPAGWTVDSVLVTATTNSPTSAANSLVYPAASGNGSLVPHATYATLDTASGDVQVSATARWAALSTGEQDVWLFARSSVVAADANWGTLTYYHAGVSRAGATPGLFLRKRTSNTSTDLATVVGATAFADATNYRIYLYCNGTAIKAKVNKLSDNTWLNASGSWVTDATGLTYAMSVTDATITGQGYAGIGFYFAGTTGGAVGIDDWLLENFNVSSTTPTYVTPYGSISSNPNVKVTPGDGVIRP